MCLKSTGVWWSHPHRVEPLGPDRPGKPWTPEPGVYWKGRCPVSSQDLCSWELPKLMMELVTRSFSEQRSRNPCKQ